MRCLKSPIHFTWTSDVFKLDALAFCWAFLAFCWAGIPTLVLAVGMRNAFDYHEEKQFPGQRDYTAGNSYSCGEKLNCYIYPKKFQNTQYFQQQIL